MIKENFTEEMIIEILRKNQELEANLLKSDKELFELKYERNRMKSEICKLKLEIERMENDHEKRITMLEEQVVEIQEKIKSMEL